MESEGEGGVENVHLEGVANVGLSWEQEEVNFVRSFVRAIVTRAALDGWDLE